MKYLANLLVLITLVALVWVAATQLPQRSVHAAPDAQSDVREIKDWLDRYCATVTAGDFEGYRAFWTEDVIWLPPNAPVCQGIEACMEHNRPYFKDYDSVEKMSAEEVKVVGTFAFARVNYTYEGKPKPGTNVEPLKEDGKGLFLFQRRPDGSWVSTHCVWNSNLALPK